MGLDKSMFFLLSVENISHREAVHASQCPEKTRQACEDIGVDFDEWMADLDSATKQIIAAAREGK